jgi:uncharacterized membrane protein YedE/YeeE
MYRTVAAFGAGLLFGLGLTVARMIDPAKVLGFLDLAGNWDPSLAFVLGGAVITSGIGFALAGRQSAPLLADAFHMPTTRGLDRRLILGSALFGIGWGLVGICPGPALAGLAVAPAKLVLFVAAMLVGMAVYTLTEPAARSAPQKT